VQVLDLLHQAQLYPPALVDACAKRALDLTMHLGAGGGSGYTFDDGRKDPLRRAPGPLGPKLAAEAQPELVALHLLASALKAFARSTDELEPNGQVARDLVQATVLAVEQQARGRPPARTEGGRMPAASGAALGSGGQTPVGGLHALGPADDVLREAVVQDVEVRLCEAGSGFGPRRVSLQSGNMTMFPLCCYLPRRLCAGAFGPKLGMTSSLSWRLCATCCLLAAAQVWRAQVQAWAGPLCPPNVGVGMAARSSHARQTEVLARQAQRWGQAQHQSR
jgi:hypothetical protein